MTPFEGNRVLELSQAGGPLRWVVVCTLAVCLAGCRSPLNLAAKPEADDYPELTSIDRIRGPLGRLLGGEVADRNANMSAETARAREEFEQAQQLYDDGQYKQSEKQLKKIAKKYKNTSVNEDALFLIAECRFEQKRYSWAQDAYSELLKEHPSTRYMDRVTKRLFAISRVWLGFPNALAQSDVQTAGLEEADASVSPDDDRLVRDPTLAVPILPNFWDRTRPVFDTKGRALEALKAIWLNDPTGPLADDALMLTASYHLRKENYLEADRIFSILREEYPKSPHLQNAFVLGSHVKLMSYQGAQYDGKGLEEAAQLKESAMRLFPQAVDKPRLRRELKLAHEERAHRDWQMVEYWLKRRNDSGAIIYCEQIIRNFPDTSFAKRARETLAELEPDNPLLVRQESEDNGDAGATPGESGSGGTPWYDTSAESADSKLSFE